MASASKVSERFPLIPLQYGQLVFTPELQWQSRCKWRALQGLTRETLGVGIWKPEKEIKQKVDMRAIALSELGEGDTRSTRSKLSAWLKDFTAAFTNPCYRWLWIQSFFGTIGGMISGSQTFFWCHSARILR
jgi:hypothetical protein